MGIFDRLLRFIKMDRASRSVRRFLREEAKRPRYLELTRTILESIEERDFSFAVFEYVSLAIKDDHDHEFDIVSQMSQGMQAVYTTWWVQAEIDNGGFHQYFYNKGTQWALKALEGYHLLGAPKHALLMSQAIDLYRQEEEGQNEFYSGNPLTTLEEYVEARKVSCLPELDDLFYDLDEEDLVRLSFEYMKTHMDEFITQDTEERS